MNVSKRLRELRKNAGLTQEGLAEASGVSHRAIQDIERNISSPTITTLQLLAAAMGCGLGDLTGAPSAPSEQTSEGPKELSFSAALDLLNAFAKVPSEKHALVMALFDSGLFERIPPETLDALAHHDGSRWKSITALLDDGRIVAKEKAKTS